MMLARHAILGGLTGPARALGAVPAAAREPLRGAALMYTAILWPLVRLTNWHEVHARRAHS